MKIKNNTARTAADVKSAGKNVSAAPLLQRQKNVITPVSTEKTKVRMSGKRLL